MLSRAPYDEALRNSLAAAVTPLFNVRDADQCAQAISAHFLACARLEAEAGSSLRDRFLPQIRLLDVLLGPTALDAGNMVRLRHILEDPKPSLDSLQDISTQLLIAAERTNQNVTAIQRELARIMSVMENRRAVLYESARTEKPQATANGGMSVEDDKAVIATALRRSGILGSDCEVSDVAEIAGGNSKRTIVCLVSAPRCENRRLIARIDTANHISTTSVRDEYEVIAKLFEYGVVVPQPYCLENIDSSGSAMMIMSHVVGDIIGDGVATRYRSEKLCRNIGRRLAEVHSVDIARFPSLTAAQPVEEQADLELAELKERWRTEGVPNPLLEYAFSWLSENGALGRGATGLVHGDYSLHNLLILDDDVSAILDWEFVKRGRFAEDLGWVRPAAEALWSWESFMEGYVDAGGARPSLESMRYHDVYQMTRMLILMNATRLSFEKSRLKDPRYAGPIIHYWPIVVQRLGALLVD